MLRVTADSCGLHDTSAGACSCESNTVRFGHGTRYLHACRENFLIEGAKHGLSKRDLVPNLNFFMNVPIDMRQPCARGSTPFNVPLAQASAMRGFISNGSSPKPDISRFKIFGDGKGNVIARGERDCSLQRRNQEVIEETPASGISDAMRAGLHQAAITLGQSVAYESAGTVEFIYDVAREDFYFLEVNTRLQVEHPVTEAVFGIDFVEWMIRQAAEETVLDGTTLQPTGTAIEVRIYAENPGAGFRPSAGRLTSVVFPQDVRIDGWIETGAEVTPFYDPMLAIIVSADTRADAITKLAEALDLTTIVGIETNLNYLRAIARSDTFVSGRVATNVLSKFAFVP